MMNTEKRWFDIPTILLLILTLWLATLRIQVTNWTDKLSLVQYAVVMAAVVGLLLGYSTFSRKTVRWMGVSFTIMALTWLLSLLMPTSMVWGEKLLTLSDNIRLSFLEFFRNEPVAGADLFMAFMIAAYWFLGLFAGYQLIRFGKPWVPIAIIFAAFLVVDYYPPYVKSRYVYSGFIVLFLILLLGRLYFLHSQNKWKNKRAMVDYGAGLDIARTMVMASLILVTVAWGIPGAIQLLTPGTAEQQKLVEFWKPLQDRLSNAVSDLRSPRTANADFYGKSLLLGTEISEDETDVFQVQADKKRARGFRYYWRGYSYDLYEDGRWSNSIDGYRELKPSDWPVSTPEWKARQNVTLTFSWRFSRSRLLYIPDTPFSISRDVRWIGEEQDEVFDGVSFIASDSVYKDETYEAEVWVSVPTVNQLRETTLDYPDWVVERYLQLPEDLPSRFSLLAREITEGLETPFDKAQAVTDYLRDTIEYSGQIEQPPSGQEPLEWFLFESQQGFCNYYASAEVVLLRTLGIPARLVVGFVQGEELDDPNQYLVKLKDSHAWPEVFFPEIGWVEFEPTVIRPEPNLIVEDIPEIELDSDLRFEGEGGGFDLFESRRFEDLIEEGVYDEIAYLPRLYYPWREWGIFLTVFVLIGLIFWLQVFQGSEVFDRRLPILFENVLRSRGWEVPSWIEFLAYRATLSPIEKYFSEIPWMLRLVGEDVKFALTPTEQISMLQNVLPDAASGAQVLLNEYQIAIYSPRSGDVERARLAHANLWGLVIRTRLEKFFRR